MAVAVSPVRSAPEEGDRTTWWRSYAPAALTRVFSLWADAMSALQLAHTYLPSSDEESLSVVPATPSAAVSSRALVPSASSAAYQVHVSLASEGRSVSYEPQLLTFSY